VRVPGRYRGHISRGGKRMWRFCQGPPSVFGTTLGFWDHPRFLGPPSVFGPTLGFWASLFWTTLLGFGDLAFGDLARGSCPGIPHSPGIPCPGIPHSPGIPSLWRHSPWIPHSPGIPSPWIPHSPGIPARGSLLGLGDWIPTPAPAGYI